MTVHGSKLRIVMFRLSMLGSEPIGECRRFPSGLARPLRAAFPRLTG
jgi:hypothetical protein